jgi:hypothetical protein
MLLILIPIAWLAVVTVFVAVCQASALGEATAVPAEEQSYRVREGLVVWERDTAIALRYRRGSMPKPAPAAQDGAAKKRASSPGRVAVPGAR